MRSITIACSAVLALLVAVPGAATAATAPDPLFAKVLPKVKKATTIDVLLPTKLPNLGLPKNRTPVVTGGGRGFSWDIEIAFTKSCNGASVCGIGTFAAARNDRALGRADGVPVKLARGVIGRFQKVTCGANCSPPVITFKRKGVIYEFAVRLNTNTPKPGMIRMANQAIIAGPR